MLVPDLYQYNWHLSFIIRKWYDLQKSWRCVMANIYMQMILLEDILDCLCFKKDKMSNWQIKNLNNKMLNTRNFFCATNNIHTYSVIRLFTSVIFNSSWLVIKTDIQAVQKQALAQLVRFYIEEGWIYESFRPYFQIML